MLRLFIFLMLLYIYLFLPFYFFSLHPTSSTLSLQHTYVSTQAHSFAHSPVDSFESLAFTSIRSPVRSSSMRLYENALRWLFFLIFYPPPPPPAPLEHSFFPYLTSSYLYLNFYLFYSASYIRCSCLRPRRVLAELSSFQFVRHTVHLFLLLSFLQQSSLATTASHLILSHFYLTSFCYHLCARSSFLPIRQISFIIIFPFVINLIKYFLSTSLFLLSVFFIPHIIFLGSQCKTGWRQLMVAFLTWYLARLLQSFNDYHLNVFTYGPSARSADSKRLDILFFISFCVLFNENYPIEFQALSHEYFTRFHVWGTFIIKNINSGK